MSIHSEHPFLPPESERDPLRRLRGRLVAPVTVWTTGEAPDRAGLTVSSMLVATGEPGHVLGLLDPDSDLWERLTETGTAVVSVLGWQHRDLADAFAGVAPAPGGMFRLATWTPSDWGPVLDDATAWAGIRVDIEGARPVGWSVLVDGVIEHVEIAAEPDGGPLAARRGRYVQPGGPA